MAGSLPRHVGNVSCKQAPKLKIAPCLSRNLEYAKMRKHFRDDNGKFHLLCMVSTSASFGELVCVPPTEFSTSVLSLNEY